jgi:hypothetical protein
MAEKVKAEEDLVQMSKQTPAAAWFAMVKKIRTPLKGSEHQKLIIN